MTELSQEGFVTLDQVQNETPQMSLFDLQEYAVTSVTKIAELKSKIKTAKDYLVGAYKKDGEYISYEEEVKESKKRLKTRELQLNQKPDMQQVKNTVDVLKVELKEANGTVSDAALEIDRLSEGKAEMEFNGQVYDIVKVAKLVKRVQ